MQRILFVDDEPRILDGLRRMLRGLRQEWDMHFAESGAAALELLAQQPFEVLVTDMRMPGMSGAELLARVKELHPDVVRIVLSGHAERDAVMQTFGVSQQYLTKPSDQATVQRAVNRALVLRERLASPHIKQVLGGMSGLPALPSVYQELVACLKSPDVSLGEVGRIIGSDVGMTAAILKIVNSAYFGLPRPLATIERAVAFLGLDTVMSLTLEHGLFGSGEALIAVPGLNGDELRRRSLKIAAVARVLAKQEEVTRECGDEAFLAGVLHDFGMLLLASGLPERYAQVGTLAQSRPLPWEEAEREVLQTTHAEAGAYLLGLWGFEDSLIEAVLFHATPGQAPTPEWGLAGLVHVASAMVAHPQLTDPDDPALGLEPGYLARLGLRDRWPAWHEACAGVLSGSVAS